MCECCRSSALVLWERRELVNVALLVPDLADLEWEVGDARECVKSGVSRFRFSIPGEALRRRASTPPLECDMSPLPPQAASMSSVEAGRW